MISIILRSLWHYRRVHVVVMLAVAISTAVIGGSLIVGDSVRASLQQMTLQRLGRITHVLHSPRFFTQDLSTQLAARLQPSSETKVDSLISSTMISPPVISPALMLTGSVEHQDAEQALRRAGSVILLGVDDTSWSLLDHGTAGLPTERGIVLGYRTAQELQVKIADEVSVWIERPSNIPRDSLLGEREDVNLEIVLTVDAILNEDDGASRFSLNPGQQLPYNGFIALSTLQERLDLQQRDATRRNPNARPARINMLIAGQPNNTVGDNPAKADADLSETVRQDAATSRLLASLLQDSLTVADVGLNVRSIEDHGYLSVESDSMILEDSLSDAVTQAAESLGAAASPTLVYLANEIRRDHLQSQQEAAGSEAQVDKNGQSPGYSMYSIVAGLKFNEQPPLGPFVMADGSEIPTLSADDILLSEWLAADLSVSAGDFIQARWHEVGSHGDLPETHHRFQVKGILKAEDPISIDQNLTPFVEGVTNVDSFSDWDQPFEMEMDRITSRDDDYWADRRATPKAFVSLDTAEAFWKSRFGRYTSIRVAVGQDINPQQLNGLNDRLTYEIAQRLQPASLGLTFQAVRADGLRAAVGANDFTQLFLGFSFFLILSAILLASLMFRLGIQQRVAQVGLLEAVGFTAGRARQLFLGEGLLVAIAGAAAGCIIAIYFAELMIYGLTHWWIGAIGTKFLQLDLQPVKLIIAASISLFLSVIVIWRAMIVSTRRPPRELLTGASGEDVFVRSTGLRRLFGTFFQFLVFLTAVGLPGLLVTGKIPATEAFGGMSWRVVCFFLAGFAWLAAGLILLSGRLRGRTGEEVRGGRAAGIFRLAIANAARSPQRSLLTTALIAFATFVIVAVGAGRRNPTVEQPNINSGNGGFTLVAESSQPVLFDLNSAEGRSRLNLDLSPQTTLPAATTVFGFSLQPGQDASCLNLYQTTIPTMLGAMPAFIQRGGFRFADTPGENPWTLLQEPLPETTIAVPSTTESGSETMPQNLTVPTIPVIGDMNTLQFSLKKGIGDIIAYPSAAEPKFALQIVGMLDSSVFQGVVVMTDQNLKRLAPDVSGARYFLVETAADPSIIQQTAAVLETGLNAFGIDTEPVNQRLAGFLAVQNTYLSTFQMLGGLGLLVGTFGLTAVMMRNVIERRSEIALLKAVGFTTLRVVSLILIENSVLLFWGILTGTASALIAMLPHLLSTGADVPWIPLAATLCAVMLIGTLAVVFPVRAAVKTPIRETLASN